MPFPSSNQLLFGWAWLEVNDAWQVGHPILMTECECNPSFSRARMAELLFETYGVPSIGNSFCDLDMCRYELHLVVVTIYLLIRLAMLMLFLTIWIVAFGIDNAFSYKYNQKLGNCGEDGLAISCEHGTCHVVPVSSCPRYAFHQWPPYINPFGMFASFFLIISRKIVRYICVGDSTECITIFANQVEYI